MDWIAACNVARTLNGGSQPHHCTSRFRKIQEMRGKRRRRKKRFLYHTITTRSQPPEMTIFGSVGWYLTEKILLPCPGGGLSNSDATRIPFNVWQHWHCNRTVVSINVVACCDSRDSRGLLVEHTTPMSSRVNKEESCRCYPHPQLCDARARRDVNDFDVLRHACNCVLLTVRAYVAAKQPFGLVHPDFDLGWGVPIVMHPHQFQITVATSHHITKTKNKNKKHHNVHCWCACQHWSKWKESGGQEKRDHCCSEFFKKFSRECAIYKKLNMKHTYHVMAWPLV